MSQSETQVQTVGLLRHETELVFASFPFAPNNFF